VRTLVIQSHTENARETWLGYCLDSVEGWAASRGFDYRFYGDEALHYTPDWYREKLADRKPIVADLARLLLIRQALQDGYQQACWLDADVLLFAPDRLQLEYPQSCAFGREYWVEVGKHDQGAHRDQPTLRRNVHNAICVFKAGCPVLPFLIHATEQIIRRVDPAHIAPQLVGPKLLGALHNIVGFDFIETVGAFSPAVLDDLEAGSGRCLSMLLERTPVALAGANLCASLSAHRDLGAMCERLLEAGLGS
jgi:hypothetical protein